MNTHEVTKPVKIWDIGNTTDILNVIDIIWHALFPIFNKYVPLSSTNAMKRSSEICF